MQEVRTSGNHSPPVGDPYRPTLSHLVTPCHTLSHITLLTVVSTRICTGDGNQSRFPEPSYLLRGLDRSRVDLALLDAHAPGTVRRRRGKGIEPFEEFLISIGWSEEKAGCSVYLVDDKFQEIPDSITAQLLAAYAADRVAKGLDPSVH